VTIIGPRNQAQQLICELCLMLNKRKPAVLIPYYELETAEKILPCLAALMGKPELTYRATAFVMQDKDAPDKWQIRCYIISFKAPLKVGEGVGDEKLGEVLGYPKCCVQQYARDGGFVKAFLRYFSQASKRQPLPSDPFRLSLFRGLKGEEYYHLVSGARISHIPCSPRCAASKKMARKIQFFCLGKQRRRRCYYPPPRGFKAGLCGISRPAACSTPPNAAALLGSGRASSP